LIDDIDCTSRKCSIKEWQDTDVDHDDLRYYKLFDRNDLETVGDGIAEAGKLYGTEPDLWPFQLVASAAV
jgi:hypothetical protein